MASVRPAAADKVRCCCCSRWSSRCPGAPGAAGSNWQRRREEGRMPWQRLEVDGGFATTKARAWEDCEERKSK